MPDINILAGIWHEISPENERPPFFGKFSCQMPSNILISGIWHEISPIIWPDVVSLVGNSVTRQVWGKFHVRHKISPFLKHHLIQIKWGNFQSNAKRLVQTWNFPTFKNYRAPNQNANIWFWAYILGQSGWTVESGCPILQNFVSFQNLSSELRSDP